jgi:hypothetical protein
MRGERVSELVQSFDLKQEENDHQKYMLVLDDIESMYDPVRTQKRLLRNLE